jgi:hypothetical protein
LEGENADAAAIAQQMDDLHQGLLMKVFAAVVPTADSRTIEQRQLGRVLLEHLWGKSVMGHQLHEAVRRYAHLRLVAIARSALCDATHSIRHRCVRRLLTLHDCARADHFPLTQQMLAGLLGVRRASVSVAAEALQGAGLIVYEHGRMHIANRAGLEEAACGCYRQMREQVDSLVSPVPG